MLKIEEFEKCQIFGLKKIAGGIGVDTTVSPGAPYSGDWAHTTSNGSLDNIGKTVEPGTPTPERDPH
jgi:hypothetical protein